MENRKNIELNKFKIAVRQALADYISSEGCSCCQNIDKHNEAQAKLAELLNVPPYGDESGYDFVRFKTS